jgi:hypothetical protein
VNLSNRPMSKRWMTEDLKDNELAKRRHRSSEGAEGLHLFRPKEIRIIK